MSKINIDAYQVGTIVRAASARVKAEETSPPSYYTEASLLDDMREAHKFATNDADREALKVTNGIGTARTRGQVIKELLESKSIERKGKGKSQKIVVTPAGRALSTMAPKAMKNVTMTAKWEILFAQIEKGTLEVAQFKRVIRMFVAAIVDEVKKKKESNNGAPVWNHAQPNKAK